MLGESYNYASQIKLPAEIGMSSDGNLSALGRDINGLTEYIGALVAGGSKATKAPYLGDKYFLKTNAQCKATDTGEIVDRYIYINNVPSGNIPFISGAMGVNFSEFRGLIPGVMSQLNNFDPSTIINAFTEGATPDCIPISLQTVDLNNSTSMGTNYVTTVDLGNMDPCDFPNGRNIVTNQQCRQAFTNMGKGSGNNKNEYSYINKYDYINNLYLLSLSTIALYIIYRITNK